VECVRFDRENQCFLICAIHKARTDVPLPAQLRDLDPMHSIDDAHAALLHENWRKLNRRGRVGQQPDMRGIGPCLAQMECWYQLAYRDPDL
jgi:hypothetical protein